jgi:hypothetical protein
MLFDIDKSKTRMILLGLVTFLMATTFVGAVLASHDWNPKEFIFEGSYFRDGDPNGSFGYDGQFVYYIVLDPFGAAPRTDHAAYRYLRVLYPLLVWLLAIGGQPFFVPWIMILINIIAITAATSLLGEILVSKKAVPARHALGFPLIAGVLLALRADLNEPLAISLALCGLLLFHRRHLIWAAVAFALALLAKEVALPFLLGLVVWLGLNRRLRSGILVLVIGSAPMIIWGRILTTTFGHSPFGVLPLEKIPFSSLRYLRFYPLGGLIFLGVALPGIVFGAISLIDLLRKQASLDILILLANVGFIAFMPRITWINIAGAFRAAIGLAVASLIFAAWSRPRLLPWTSAFWVISGLLMVPVLISTNF